MLYKPFYQHKLIILHFDQVKVPMINEEFEKNVLLLIKQMIYKESLMEFVLMNQPKNKNFFQIKKTKKIKSNLFFKIIHNLFKMFIYFFFHYVNLLFAHQINKLKTKKINIFF